MLSSRLLLIACLAVVSAGCKKPPAPTTRTQTVGLWMNGERRGEERVVFTIEEGRTTLRTETDLNGPSSVVRLEGQLVLERGRATTLRVTGEAPASLAALADVTTTPDRTDTFPIRGPLPVHVLAALARQSMSASRRRFLALPDGEVTLGPCPAPEAPFTDATCHRVTGLPSGDALVWIDRRGQLAAAVARTPWGPLLATPADRDGSHPALLKQFDVYSAPD
jgi:hypothetical protein